MIKEALEILEQGPKEDEDEIDGNEYDEVGSIHGVACVFVGLFRFLVLLTNRILKEICQEKCSV